MYIVTSSLSLSLKHDSNDFKCLQFKERSLNSPFMPQISVNGGPNRRNRTSFSNFVWRSEGSA